MYRAYADHAFSRQPQPYQYLYTRDSRWSQVCALYTLRIFSADTPSALKRWVLTSGWRNARYVMEPGYVQHTLRICSAYTPSRGPAGGLIDRYATACEAIAYVAHTLSTCSANFCSRVDPAFAATFGDQFHRAVSTAYVRHMLHVSLFHILPYITIYCEYLSSRHTLSFMLSVYEAYSQTILSFLPK